MAAKDKIIFEHDVWQVRTEEPRPSLDNYTYKVGYITTHDKFRWVYMEYFWVKEARDKKAHTVINKVKRFASQKDISKKLLRFLLKVEGKMHIASKDLLYWETLPRAELMFRGVPVPIHRQDFPNKSAILLILDTKIQALEERSVCASWREWWQYFKEETQGQWERKCE